MDQKDPAAERIAAAMKQYAALKADEIAKPNADAVKARVPISNVDCAVIANSTGKKESIIRALFPKLIVPKAPKAA